MDDLFAPSHLILLVIIGLLVFGPGKLPELGASVGKAIREFKGSMAGITGAVDDVRASVTGTPAAGQAPAPQPQQAAPAQAAQGQDGSTPPAA